MATKNFQEKEVEIISVYPLSVDEINKIKKISLFKDRKVVNIVDKKIIAGLIIRFDSCLIDLSFSSFLDSLKNKIYEK